MSGLPARPPVLAFTFTQEPVKLLLTTERRKPDVTVKQLLVARIEEGTVKVSGQLPLLGALQRHQIAADQYSGRRDTSHNTTAAIREKMLDPQPGRC